MYPNIIKGIVFIIASYLNIPYFISDKLTDGNGTRALSQKNTNNTAKHKYTEHKTPNIDVNLSWLIDLGIDIGNRIPNY